VLRDDFIQAYARDLPAVVQCFRDDFDACIAPPALPAPPSPRDSHDQPPGAVFLEERRRTKIIPHAFGERTRPSSAPPSGGAG
jgi:hypothetical protein